MFRPLLKACLLGICAFALAACGASSSDSGLSINGNVETGGPWKPYDNEWKEEPHDLPTPKDGHDVSLTPLQQTQEKRQLTMPPSNNNTNLPSYGIPEYQRSPTFTPQEPSVQQIIRKEFPEPAQPPANAGHIDIQP
ncbi:MAG: hypothetical protein J5861_03160 [Desulfovibrio sp.]|nr:hypothetical protein [Desulfovibrio sp.]